MYRRSLIQVFAPLLALVWTVPAFSQDSEEAEMEETTLEEVIVTDERLSSIAFKTPLSFLETPLSVGVVSSGLLDSQSAVGLGDALKNVSGAQAQGGFGVFETFLIRGFESLSSGLVMTDGSPEPEVGFYDLYNIERVEVLKGPGAFLYGGNALSGTVNLARKKPTGDTFAHFRFGYGQFNTRGAAADFGWGEDTPISVRLNTMWEQSDRYRDDKESGAVAVNPSFLYELDESTTIGAELEYSFVERKSDAGIPLIPDMMLGQGNSLLPNTLPDVPRTTSYQSDADMSEQTTLRAQLNFETKLSDRFTLRDKLYFTDFKWDSAGSLFAGFGLDRGVVDAYRVLTELDDAQVVIGNQLEALLSVKTGPVPHEFLIGLDAARWTDEFTIDVSAISPIGVYDFVTFPIDPIPLPQQSQAADASSLILAPYVVDRLNLTEDIQVFLGARFDSISYEDPITETERSYSQLSPLAGAVYPLSESGSVYASFSQSFAPPSARVVGEPEAETAQQAEIGTKHLLMDGKAQISLALFRMEKDIQLPDDSGVLSQTGTQLSQGAEIDIAAELKPGWTAMIAYAFTDAEYTELIRTLPFPMPDGSIVPTNIDYAGNTPQFAPSHLLHLWTEKRLENGLGVSAGWRYVGAQFIAPDNAYELDGYSLLDASAFYEYEGFRVRLTGKNLTDVEYEMWGFGGLSLIPGNPREAFLSVEWGFGG
ncbi:MAG: TonB-dependent siderophore receptor [Candidatus Poribacteria bacterium]|nr:TonB-dependent siderophore receptor [Candidatus Poribacteria bacterium]